MQEIVPLEEGCVYHIYNRGINGENIFREERNYHHFLSLYAKYVFPVADTFAYCLLKNHFHFLVRIKDVHEFNPDRVQNPVRVKNYVSRKFSHMFNSYAQSINSAFNRTGGLFETPFKRKKVTAEAYFTAMIGYIHLNPVKHRFVKSPEEYIWSSYHSFLSNRPTKLNREEVLSWFGGVKEFKDFHQAQLNEKEIEAFIIEMD